jgi:hypothetical protein
VNASPRKFLLRLGHEPRGKRKPGSEDSEWADNADDEKSTSAVGDGGQVRGVPDCHGSRNGGLQCPGKRATLTNYSLLVVNARIRNRAPEVTAPSDRTSEWVNGAGASALNHRGYRRNCGNFDSD